MLLLRELLIVGTLQVFLRAFKSSTVISCLPPEKVEKFLPMFLCGRVEISRDTTKQASSRFVGTSQHADLGYLVMRPTCFSLSFLFDQMKAATFLNPQIRLDMI